MNPTLMSSIRTLLAHPDRPDRDALLVVLNDTHASNALACLAPTGSLAQIAAALSVGWSWTCDGVGQHTDALIALVTDSRCSRTDTMIITWSRIPKAVGVLRDWTDPLIAWAEQRLVTDWYANLAILLGPSNESARLLVQSSFPSAIGRTLRRWSMGIDPDNPTAWQAMIDADLRAVLHQNENLSRAFPAWGWDDAVDPDDVLTGIVDDLTDGWWTEHPSLQGRNAWIERQVDSNLHVVSLALVASIGRSDALAEAVCVRIVQDPLSIYWIARIVPWSRLHPHIQPIIDETMRQVSDRWKRTWASAIGHAPVVSDTIIVSDILLWRIDPERWDALDPALRADLVARKPLPFHCYGWGVHPNLVAGNSRPNGRVFRFWNPDVPPDDLRAWAYADRLLKQTSLQESQEMIDLLDILPSDRRARFDQIIDGRLVGQSKSTDQPPWDWTVWVTLPTSERLRRLRARLRALWGNRTTPPAYRGWMARSHLLDTVAVAVRALLDGRRAPHIIAALLAQIPALRVHMPKPGPPLPFPDDLKDAHRAQIERLSLDRDVQAYVAWCLRVLDQDMVAGSTLIALHPTVAVALAPLLNADQQKAVAASPAAQGWDSMTIMHWAAACAAAQEPTTIPIQRRIR